MSVHSGDYMVMFVEFANIYYPRSLYSNSTSDWHPILVREVLCSSDCADLYSPRVTAYWYRIWVGAGLYADIFRL